MIVVSMWSARPSTGRSAHWGIHDPAAVEGTEDEKARAFNKAFRELDARLKIFTSLRLDMLDELALKRQLDEIGRMREESGTK
jgi:arsenate reductase